MNTKQPLLIVLAIAMSVLSTIALVVVASHRPPSAQPAVTDLPADFGVVPSFTLTERSGRTVTNEDFKGTVWVAAFIFTRCQATCPMVTGRMAELRSQLPADVRLVTFTVDPEHDSPEVLASYADERAKADADSWWFLTGDRNHLHELITDGFKLGVRENPIATEEEERFTHSSRLVLIDKHGRIRGYYESSDPAAVAVLRDKIRKLQSETALEIP